LKVLIAGDMVLPRISTNVSVTDLEPEDDPLGLYLHSLAVIAQRVPADTLVLPSHGKPFIGLHPRIAALRQHHVDRLAEVIQACTEAPCSATDLLPVLFPRSLDAEQTGFALSETIAHTNHLWHQGRLQRQLGADGVLRFSVRSAR
jgi:glyoxylase-like metal-dependent hydrolase (beta-lactamase superfamily II)